MESRRIDKFHIRILECTRERYYVHSNEIYGWMSDDLPNRAIFLRYLEDLEFWNYLEFDLDKGYIRTKLGTELVKKFREKE